jgi:hypothetical protein
MRKVLLGILILLVALFLGALIYASTQSPDFAVQGTTVIGAPADSLYARFATPRTWARWSAWTTRVDSSLRYAYEGPETGTGAVMKFTSQRMGNGSLRIGAVAPGREVNYDLAIVGFETKLHGKVTLEPAPEGTRITWRDSGSLGQSLLVRLLKPYLDRNMAVAYDTSFAGLRQEFGAR